LGTSAVLVWVAYVPVGLAFLAIYYYFYKQVSGKEAKIKES